VTYQDVKVISERQIPGKWYNMDLYIEWLTNRNSYIIYRTALLSMKLNDSYIPPVSRSRIVWRWVLQKKLY